MAKSRKELKGELMDESIHFSLEEICHIGNVHAEYIISMVEYGILEPAGEIAEWEFSLPEVERFEKALRLHKDLKINFSGIALVLQLLEQIKEAENRVKKLEQQLESFKIP